MSTTMATALADLDQLAGDIAAYQFLLDEITAERDAYRRKVEALTSELATAQARANR
jgi:cell division protein FtsB